MRFLADAGVPLRLVRWLRNQGHDAVHLRDEGLQQAADDEIFARAARDGRIVLTFDLDFSEIAALSAGHRASVVLFRLRNAATTHVIERLAATLPAIGVALAEGAVVVIEKSRYRVRRLPVGGGAE